MSKFRRFDSRKCIGKIVWEMATIFGQGRWVNTLVQPQTVTGSHLQENKFLFLSVLHWLKSALHVALQPRRCHSMLRLLDYASLQDSGQTSIIEFINKIKSLIDSLSHVHAHERERETWCEICITLRVLLQTVITRAKNVLFLDKRILICINKYEITNMNFQCPVIAHSEFLLLLYYLIETLKNDN